MARKRRPAPVVDPRDVILDKQFVMTDTGRIDRIRDLYTTYNPAVDLEALKEGGYIDVLDKMMEPVTMSFNDHSPQVLAYWAKRGMVKEFHGEDVPMSWEAYEMKTGCLPRINMPGHPLLDGRQPYFPNLRRVGNQTKLKIKVKFPDEKSGEI